MSAHVDDSACTTASAVDLDGSGDVAVEPEVPVPATVADPGERGDGSALYGSSERPVIETVQIRRFKQFRSLDVSLKGGVSLVAGANNAGKSTLLHALAVWEFCRTATIMERGGEALLPESVGRQGFGIGDDEFSPINVPSLKHLWTNLKSAKSDGDADGYTLSICAEWSIAERRERLGFSLSLANDRLFIKTSESSVQDLESVPRCAYLPPFAGIQAREERVGGAIRRRRTGEGVAGAVLRNLLLDMKENNAATRARLKEGRDKIGTAALRRLREEDSWELLQQAMRIQFGAEIQVDDFSEEYHSYIKVEIIKGDVNGYKLKKYPHYNARDLMVEGSGFLQWLNVYALAVNPEVDVLLLDEPDAHLHPSLQRSLLAQLEGIANTAGKQALVATHSAEILRNSLPVEILQITGPSSAKYLSLDHQKAALLEGIGSSFSPKFEKVRESKRIFFYEGSSDLTVLQELCGKLGWEWPTSIALYPTTYSHKQRADLWQAFKGEYGQDVEAFSLRDLDTDELNTVGERLRDKNYSNRDSGFHAKKWRRRHLESYLMWPDAIAEAAGLPKSEVVKRLAEDHGLSVGESFVRRNAPDALLTAQSKGILGAFGCDAVAVARKMPAAAIPDDVKELLCELMVFAGVEPLPTW